MKKNEGFTMIETISAFSILLVITIFLLPILTFVQSSQKDLSLEREVHLLLHDEFYNYIQTSDEFPYFKSDTTILPVRMSFQIEKGWIEGCAEWKNHHKRSKEFCLYAPYEE
ncbi:type II secretion system protein [Halobacillus litoralis]|uniref:type II secretion system protein n=1 Tax=Halobacillus litoralis TaxID=45668 RepID=UPI0024908AF4|nr:type II secretion system protein [Halobacillus litoralis]